MCYLSNIGCKCNIKSQETELVLHTCVQAKGSTGCCVLERHGDWSCFNLILKASLFLLLRGGQDCGICACVCWSICLVYSVGNGEEMCFQFYLIYSACLRFYLKLSFLRCSDKKQDFEIKVWVTEKAKIKIELYLQKNPQKTLFKKIWRKLK